MVSGMTVLTIALTTRSALLTTLWATLLIPGRTALAIILPIWATLLATLWATLTARTALAIT